MPCRCVDCQIARLLEDEDLMTPIESLKRAVEAAMPLAKTDLRPPRHCLSPSWWWLDIRLPRGVLFVVQWNLAKGFGLSTDVERAGYGEGPDETFDSPQAVLVRLQALYARETG